MVRCTPRSGLHRRLRQALGAALGVATLAAAAGTTATAAGRVTGSVAGSDGMCGALAPPAEGEPCGLGLNIQFGQGENSWEFDGGIYDTTQVWYFWASADQLLQFNFSAADRNVGLRGFAPDGSVILDYDVADSGYAEARLPADGRYALVVFTDDGSPYGMTMGIDAPHTVTMGTYDRIAFAAGTDNDTVGNAVLANDKDVWIFGADAGQHADVTLTSIEDNAVFTLIDPYGETLAAATSWWGGTLPADGTYMLIVAPTARNATYELALAIPDGTSEPDGDGARRIQFAPGTDNAVISGTLAPGAGQGWVLAAAAGQQLIIDAVGDFAIVEVFDADGHALATRGSSNAQVIADLATDGDYQVYVWAPADAAANFEFRLTIP